MIDFRHVSFRPRRNLEILKSVHFSINAGDFIVLLGGNGSGKSTLIKLINGLYLCSRGAIFYQAKPLNQYSAKQRSRDIISLNQFATDSLFSELSIEENARLIFKAEQPCSRSQLLTAVKARLKHFKPALATAMKQPIADLSGGEQQIVALTLYLQNKPKLLLLDEHTSALDPKTAKKIMQFTADTIAADSLTCLMATHNLDFAQQYGNRLLTMKKGQLHSLPADKASMSKSCLLKHCYD